MTVRLTSPSTSSSSNKAISVVIIAVISVLLIFGPDAVSSLKCYKCNPCTNNPGELVSCSEESGEYNCYVATGRRALFEGSVRGCYANADISIPQAMYCTNYSSYVLDGQEFTDVNACICGMSGCNYYLPARAIPSVIFEFSFLFGILILSSFIRTVLFR